MRAPARAAQLAAAWLLALAAAAGAQVLPEIGASGSNSTAGGSDSPCARAYELGATFGSACPKDCSYDVGESGSGPECKRYQPEYGVRCTATRSQSDDCLAVLQEILGDDDAKACLAADLSISEKELVNGVEYIAGRCALVSDDAEEGPDACAASLTGPWQDFSNNCPKDCTNDPSEYGRYRACESEEEQEYGNACSEPSLNCVGTLDALTAEDFACFAQAYLGNAIAGEDLQGIFLLYLRPACAGAATGECAASNARWARWPQMCPQDCADCSEDPDSEMRCCERGEEEYGHACRESECAAYLSSFTHEDLECHPSVITGDLPIDSLVEYMGQFASVCSPGASECHEAPNYFQEVDEACERDCTTDDDDRDLPQCERGQYERGKKCAGDKKCSRAFEKAFTEEAATCFIEAAQGRQTAAIEFMVNVVGPTLGCDADFDCDVDDLSCIADEECGESFQAVTVDNYCEDIESLLTGPCLKSCNKCVKKYVIERFQKSVCGDRRSGPADLTGEPAEASCSTKTLYQCGLDSSCFFSQPLRRCFDKPSGCVGLDQAACGAAASMGCFFDPDSALCLSFSPAEAGCRAVESLFSACPADCTNDYEGVTPWLPLCDGAPQYGRLCSTSSMCADAIRDADPELLGAALREPSDESPESFWSWSLLELLYQCQSEAAEDFPFYPMCGDSCDFDISQDVCDGVEDFFRSRDCLDSCSPLQVQALERANVKLGCRKNERDFSDHEATGACGGIGSNDECDDDDECMWSASAQRCLDREDHLECHHFSAQSCPVGDEEERRTFALSEDVQVCREVQHRCQHHATRAECDADDDLCVWYSLNESAYGTCDKPADDCYEYRTADSCTETYHAECKWNAAVGGGGACERMPEGCARFSGRDECESDEARTEFGCIYDSAQARCMDPPNSCYEITSESTCAAVFDLYSEGVLDDETFKGGCKWTNADGYSYCGYPCNCCNDHGSDRYTCSADPQCYFVEEGEEQSCRELPSSCWEVGSETHCRAPCLWHDDRCQNPPEMSCGEIKDTFGAEACEAFDDYKKCVLLEDGACEEASCSSYTNAFQCDTRSNGQCRWDGPHGSGKCRKYMGWCDGYNQDYMAGETEDSRREDCEATRNFFYEWSKPCTWRDGRCADTVDEQVHICKGEESGRACTGVSHCEWVPGSEDYEGMVCRPKSCREATDADACNMLSEAMPWCYWEPEEGVCVTQARECVDLSGDPLACELDGRCKYRPASELGVVGGAHGTCENKWDSCRPFAGRDEMCGNGELFGFKQCKTSPVGGTGNIVRCDESRPDDCGSFSDADSCADANAWRSGWDSRRCVWRPRLGGDGGACIDTDENDKCAAATTEESCENTMDQAGEICHWATPEYFEPMCISRPWSCWDVIDQKGCAADMTISGNECMMYTEKKEWASGDNICQDFSCHELANDRCEGVLGGARCMVNDWGGCEDWKCDRFGDSEDECAAAGGGGLCLMHPERRECLPAPCSSFDSQDTCEDDRGGSRKARCGWLDGTCIEMLGHCGEYDHHNADMGRPSQDACMWHEGGGHCRVRRWGWDSHATSCTEVDDECAEISDAGECEDEGCAWHSIRLPGGGEAHACFEGGYWSCDDGAYSEEACEVASTADRRCAWFPDATSRAGVGRCKEIHDENQCEARSSRRSCEGSWEDCMWASGERFTRCQSSPQSCHEYSENDGELISACASHGDGTTCAVRTDLEWSSCEDVQYGIPGGWSVDRTYCDDASVEGCSSKSNRKVGCVVSEPTWMHPEGVCVLGATVADVTELEIVRGRATSALVGTRVRVEGIVTASGVGPSEEFSYVQHDGAGVAVRLPLRRGQRVAITAYVGYEDGRASLAFPSVSYLGAATSKELRNAVAETTISALQYDVAVGTLVSIQGVMLGNSWGEWDYPRRFDAFDGNFRELRIAFRWYLKEDEDDHDLGELDVSSGDYLASVVGLVLIIDDELTLVPRDRDDVVVGRPPADDDSKKKKKKSKKKESAKKAKKAKKLSKKQVKKLCKKAKSKKKCRKGDAKKHCSFSKKKGCAPK